jgi:uncharacterized protein (DUF2062 family)
MQAHLHDARNRFRMPRRLLRRLLPEPQKIRDHHSLRALRGMLLDPNLWHLNRRSVSTAAFVGVFIAFVPLPTQMVMAAFVAILLRCNISLSVAGVWLTNPITMPPIYYGTYLLGAWLMDVPANPGRFDLTFDWMLDRLEPFLLGCFVCGTVLGALAFVAMRIAWRVAVTMKWRARQRRRAAR